MSPRIPPEIAAEVGELFDQTAADLFVFARTLLRDVDRGYAEDLVQTTFQEAALSWEQLATRDHEGRRRWLFTVLRNKAIDSWRRNKRQQPWADPPDRADPAAAPGHQALCRIALLKCWAAIAQMPATRREVARLRWYREWKTQEIADHIGIAQTTVRGHLKAARDELVTQFGAEVPFLDIAEDDASGADLGREDGKA